MAKGAGGAPLEDFFKEPTKQKEAIREELKCEDFSLILAQWKASSGRKMIHATAAAGVVPRSAVPTGLVRDNVPPLPAEESAVPAQPQTQIPSAGGKAAQFWSMLKVKPSGAATTAV